MSPVYVAVAFDDRGTYDGTSGPPPPGTPVGIYRPRDAKNASPVEPRDGITITFDDTNRMQ